jgi:hypothetical protein
LNFVGELALRFSCCLGGPQLDSQLLDLGLACLPVCFQGLVLLLLLGKLRLELHNMPPQTIHLLLRGTKLGLDAMKRSAPAAAYLWLGRRTLCRVSWCFYRQ